MRLIDANRLKLILMFNAIDPLEAIDNMPTVEPKKGRWISVCRGKQCNCSVCNERYDHTYEFVENWNFCPNCGAKMVEPQKGDKHGRY